MKFGGVAMTGGSVARHVEVAKLAEELGYESAWVTEVSGPDAVTVLAAAAGATSRLKLATGIVPIYARDPYLMAMTVASLQELSGGRIIAGFGTSTPAIITGWHGLAFERPVATTRAYVGLVRRFLAGERVKSDGQYRITGASIRAGANSATPIYLAALNERMLELAGEIADGVILNFPTVQYATRAVAAIERGLARAGRDRANFDLLAFVRSGITQTFDDVALMVKRELLSYCLTPVYQKVFTADGFGAEVAAVGERWRAGDRAGAALQISDHMAAEHAAIGTVARCEAQLDALAATGIDRFVLFPVVPEGAGGSRAMDTVRAFAPGVRRGATAG